MPINRIEILIPSALIALYTKYNTGENIDLFNADSLVLYLQPDAYTPVTEDLGELGFVDGVAATTVAIAARRYGFEIKTQESRECVYKMLKAIARNAASGGLYQAIAVRDYVHLEEVDEATGFTLRNMRLESLSNAAGTLRSLPSDVSPRYVVGGITFRMMEIEPREVW